jgi:hypothetical protein
MFIELIYICVETKILIDATFQKWNAIKQQQKRLRRRHVRSPTPTPEFREHVGANNTYKQQIPEFHAERKRHFAVKNN